MELMTRCPACGTTFAASLEQLQLRKGYVRCVGCAHIFDGYEAVVPASAAAEPHLPSPDAEPRPAETFPAAVARPRNEPVAEPFLGAGRQTPAYDEPSFADEPAFRSQERAYQPYADEPVLGTDAPARHDEDDDVSIYGEPRNQARPPVPGFLAKEEPVRRSGWARLGWLVLILAGLLLALAQAAYVYRMQLAVQWPWLRPWLETACQRLECKVPYARSIKHLSITDSSLQRQAGAVGKQGARRMVFEALLRNNLDAPQQWPVLWLELTDVSGAVLSRRYLPPDVYLAPRAGGPAMGAASERRISLTLDVDSEHVSGYQVGLFFP